MQRCAVLDLQRLDHNRERSPFRLTQQQMHRLAHDGVSIDGGIVAVEGGLQRTLEGLACVRTPKVRLSTVAGKRDEVMMSASVSPFQTYCHSGKADILQTHISKSSCGAPECDGVRCEPPATRCVVMIGPPAEMWATHLLKRAMVSSAQHVECRSCCSDSLAVSA